MKTMVLLLMVALLEYGTGPGDVVAQVQQKCPAEVAQTQAALKSTQTATKSKAVAEGPQDIQAPRSAAGARTQGVNAPRTQEVNAPRGPAGVREPDIDAPRLEQAEGLVNQAQTACKKGDMAAASAKAKQALSLLKK